MKVITSTVQAECGLACIAMVSTYHGNRLELSELRERISPSVRGTNVRQIIEWASTLGLQAKAMRLRVSDMTRIFLPAILHWRFTHFVVLERVTNTHFVVIDPSEGRTKLTREQFSEAFTGIAVEIAPAPNFVAAVGGGRRLGLQDVWPRVSGDTGGFILLAALSVAAQSAVLITPLFAQQVIDHLVNKEDGDATIAIVAGFTLIALFGVLAQLVRRLITLLLGTRITSVLVGSTAWRLLNLPIDWFDRRHIGDIESRFSSTVEVQSFVTGHAVTSVVDFLLLVAVLLAMSLISAGLALLVTLLTSANVAIIVLSAGRLGALEDLRLLHRATQSTKFYEIIRNIASIKLRNGELSRWTAWHNSYSEMLEVDNRYRQTQAYVDSTTAFLATIGPIVLLTMSALFVTRGDVTVGALTGIAMLYMAMTGPVARLATAVHDYLKLRVHLDRLADIVLAKDKRSTLKIDASDLPPGVLLRLSDVSFGYHQASSILSKVSLDLKKGGTIGILGRTGCGKTSLLKLMVGVLEPSSGSISINLPDDGTGGNWLDRIGVVLQDDQLMSGSIAENIAFFDAPIDMQAVREAARLACIDEDILAMPMQYDTPISDIGTAFSGGQRQRIMLARALYRKPTLLFLDEATAHLDVDTERAVFHNLTAAGLSMVVITHRPQSVEFMTGRYMLEGGRLRPLVASS